MFITPSFDIQKQHKMMKHYKYLFDVRLIVDDSMDDDKSMDDSMNDSMNDSMDNPVDVSQIIEWYESHYNDFIDMFGVHNPVVYHNKVNYVIEFDFDEEAEDDADVDTVASMLVDIDDDGNDPITCNKKTYLVQGVIVN